MIYKKQQISPVSSRDLAQGLVALPRLPRRDSEWKRKSQLGEIPGAWTDWWQRPPLSKDLLSAPHSLGLPALPPWLCHCRHCCATAIITMPLPSSPCHHHPCCATTIIPPATTIIAVPSPSSPCHCCHCCATTVVPVPPPPLPAGDWALAKSAGKGGWLRLPPVQTSIVGGGSILGTWQKLAEPRGVWVGGGCQQPARAWVVLLPVKPRGAHGSPGCRQHGSVILLLFLESWLPSSSPE